MDHKGERHRQSLEESTCGLPYALSFPCAATQRTLFPQQRKCGDMCVTLLPRAAQIQCPRLFFEAVLIGSVCLACTFWENSRLPEGKQGPSLKHTVCINSLSTVSHSHQFSINWGHSESYDARCQKKATLTSRSF